MDFKIKRGDTSPSIKLKLTPGINLAGATVVFNVDGQSVTDINISRAAATFDNSDYPTSSTLIYEWVALDTAVAGLAAKAEFEVTYSDGTIESFPREGFINVRVTNDLG